MTDRPSLLRRLPRMPCALPTTPRVPDAMIGHRKPDHMRQPHPNIIVAGDQTTSGDRHFRPDRRLSTTVAPDVSMLSP